MRNIDIISPGMIYMSLWISLLNDAGVSIFGSLLSASFCGALDDRKKRWVFASCIVVILLLQGGIYYVGTDEFVKKIYPLIMHMPLWIVLAVLKRKFLWPLISIMLAYLCCQLRRWSALLVVSLISGDIWMQDLVELIVTIPLFILILRLVSPVMKRLLNSPVKLQWQFGVVPALYYGFDYLTQVYTNLLSSGAPVVVEFMPFVCCAAYLVFLIYHSEKEQKQIQLKQIQKSLDLQLNQAVREISTLRENQEVVRRYRHDLRHHLLYLDACIENGNANQAKEYIAGICKEIESQKIRRYCENEVANLVLSSFVGRAKKEGIDINIDGGLSSVISLSDRDLCVLLCNALENALHACQSLASKGKKCMINVRLTSLPEKKDSFCLQVANPYEGEIQFENGIPVSYQPEHGIGLQSICAIVERYEGIYSFTTKDEKFILRLSI